jgi:tRNA pseudouridine38-40 synthase
MGELCKVKCILSYDGGSYGGYQVQKNTVTIQELLEAAVKEVTGESITTYASGRTDAGVHAKGQVFHFETVSQISPERWPFALNRLLPQDIVILSAEIVPADFHARFDVVEKIYKYCIWNQRIPNLFFRNYCWHIPARLDLQAMQEAAAYLVGEHDFTSFCSFKTAAPNRVRHVYEISLEVDAEERIWFTFRGKGFLYNMVRIIVGTLVDVGRGKKTAESVKTILASQNRLLAGKTAPAKGLFLWEVKY